VNLKYEIGLDAANIINHQNIKLTTTEPAAGEDPEKKTYMHRIMISRQVMSLIIILKPIVTNINKTEQV
jgi:hypothetical protein